LLVDVDNEGGFLDPLTNPTAWPSLPKICQTQYYGYVHDGSRSTKRSRLFTRQIKRWYPYGAWSTRSTLAGHDS